MPPPRKPRAGACELAVRRDLAKLPKDLAESALAVSALAMAAGIDDRENSLTSRTMAQGRLQDAMAALRALAPPKQEAADGLDDIAAQRAKRLATSGSAASPDM